MKALIDEAVELLQQLIRVQSYSGEESATGDIIQNYLEDHGVNTHRIYNNIIARSQYWDGERPTVVLNSHHDTVGIGAGWTEDPLGGVIKDGKLYGRGSNDAGGCLVSLMAAFLFLRDKRLSFNLMLIASGEEENFGSRGVSAALKEIEMTPDLGIIGEPTEMHLAIAEKGLIVIDGEIQGEGGHAARDIGKNAIYLAIEDLRYIKDYSWDRVSEVLGRTKTTVTQIEAGSQHNVIPDRCHYVIDCRVNERYTLREVLDELQRNTHAQLTPRSLRWHPSGIPIDHPVVKRGTEMGRRIFGSPTLSDQVHFSCPSVKIGPGVSVRSHTADEFIRITEIEEGIRIYIELLEGLHLVR